MGMFEGGGGGSSTPGEPTGFDAITTGTNTTAAMTVGTGASLGASGSGSITATAVTFANVTAGTNVAPAGLTVGSGGSITYSGTGTVNANQIAGTAVSGTTGTTNVVFSNTPTLVTPVLGAATGTSLALGGGTVLTSTNQTGTGSLVLATSPTLTTPNIGVATATSLVLPNSATFDGSTIQGGTTSSLALQAGQGQLVTISGGGHVGTGNGLGVAISGANGTTNGSGAAVVLNGGSAVGTNKNADTVGSVTITSCQGTGTGTIGKIILRSAPTQGSGTSVQVPNNTMMMDNSKLVGVSGMVLGFSSSATDSTTAADTGISRDSAGVIDFGTGAAGSKAATINAAIANFTGLTTTAGLSSSGSVLVANGNVVGFNTAGLDAGISRTAANTLAFGNGSASNATATLNFASSAQTGTSTWNAVTNGAQIITGNSVTEEITLAVGNVSSVAVFFPANSFNRCLVARVTQAITGTGFSSYTFQDDTLFAQTYGTNLSPSFSKQTTGALPAMTANIGSVSGSEVYEADAKLVIGTSSATITAGKIRVTAFYDLFVPPTS